MILPDSAEPFRVEAQKLVAAGMAQEIVFSGPTYQVHIRDGKEPIWVFLQLDHEDKIKDLFCNCEQCSETGACIHTAMALFAIFRGFSQPLHQRFESSVFFHLFSAIAKESCDEVICRQEGTILRWEDGHHTVLLEGSSELMAEVRSLAHGREEETEETSIKFSDLSDEELDNWRRGVASDRLRFELSPHADLAKKLFLMSEQRPCRFHFEEQGIPRRLFCRWPELSCTFPIAGALTDLLESVPSSLATPNIERYGGKQIKGLEWDEKEQQCRIVLSGEETDLSGALRIETSQWWYLPSGCFVKQLNKKSLLIQDPVEIALFLDTHETPKEPLSLSYHLTVDKRQGLTITPYRTEPFDLEGALFFGHWMHMPSQVQEKRIHRCLDPKKCDSNFGFTRIIPPLFRDVPFRVSLDDLSEFFSAHRCWLASVPGFAVHECPPREVVAYEVDANRALRFRRERAVRGKVSCIDLGEWVYIRGEGFFPKDGKSRVPYDTPIPPHRIADFIRKEADWCKEITGFFASHVPITGVGLDIRLVNQGIELVPFYQWEDPTFHEKSIFYDDMGYVPGIGFFHLPTLLAQHNVTRTYSPKDREQWDRFFLEQLPELQKQFPCSVDPRLVRPERLRLVCHGVEPQETMSELRTPTLWDASFYWESERGQAAVRDVYMSYSQGNRFLPTDAGLLDLADERFGWLTSVAPLQRGKRRRLRTYDFLKIHAHDEFSFSSEVVPSTAAMIQRLLKAVPQVPPQMSSLRCHLRPYQENGVQWLWYLYLSGLSGLLCDDMGVGKTHQAMGLLCSVKATACGPAAPRFLIVCPTSLLWHWKEKLAASAPHLRVFCYVGGDRELQEFSNGYDLLLTTYGIWRNDVKQLHTIFFEVAIFDELQIAKNHVSQVWTALSRVQAAMRLGLTGTPVENQLRELKAIFDLVLPGYLPHEELFRDSRVRGPDREGGGDRRELLARYVRPFLLRRRKQDVLQDLPSKTEEVYPTELVGEQRELYRQVASRQAVPLIQQLHDVQSPIPYMHIFALLSALKQVCNHPASYLRDIDNYTRYDSGKWETFIELLEEAQESGQKVVVFSQFLSMLDIMGHYLRQRDIGYAEIRGSTKDRWQEIVRFQQEDSCRVFLGSLQASGLGIDLTAGSVVIHYDRWWNAARENQATDRVHRIGQTRGVMVYKLMTAKTVEERIDQIISRKSQLFEEVISYDDHQIVKKLDRSELLELLDGLDKI